jgi:beta-aspartyl-peptidase (threonine type)
MSDSPSSQDDPLRFRKKAFAVGCAANVLLLATLAVLCGIFLFAIGRSYERGSTAADEKAIKAVLAEQVAAWNRGDLEGFMDGYWKSDELVFTAGDKVERGWDATRERYIKKYRSEGKDMGKLAFNELQFESLNSTTALVRGQYKLTRRGDESSGRFTLVFRKFDDGWKITSDHTSAAEKTVGRK